MLSFNNLADASAALDLCGDLDREWSDCAAGRCVPDSDLAQPGAVESPDGGG